MTRGDTSKVLSYLYDASTMKQDMESYFSQFFAQTANAFARKDATIPLNGSIEHLSPKLLVSKISLRSMQAILVALGLITIACATFIRPKTCLVEDTGTLAALSVVLSNSKCCDKHFGQQSQLEGEPLQRSAELCKYQLARVQGSCPVINIASCANLRYQVYQPLRLVCTVADDRYSLGCTQRVPLLWFTMRSPYARSLDF